MSTMTSNACLILWLSCFCGVLFTSVYAFETEEMQMFDLVEDVKISFYEFIGVPQDASASEIKKAYRKLSLSLHPDKNPDNPEVASKFRQLTSIYGILKDENMREKYNNVLEYGLPDWRQPAFYYRQLRKMSGFEMGTFSLLIAICIHYACIWGIAYETRWTKKEQLAQAYKRQKASGKKREEIDNQIKKDLDEHFALPGIWDILPFAVCRWIKSLFLLAPLAFNEIMALFRKQREETQKKQNTKKLIERQKNLEKKSKPKTAEKTRPVNLSDDTLLDLHDNLMDLDSCNADTKNKPEDDDEEEKDWLDDEVKLLVNCINRFPGGTINRWSKIAKKVGRSEREVLVKAKELQNLAQKLTKRHEFKQKHTSEPGDTSTFTGAFEIHDESANWQVDDGNQDQYEEKTEGEEEVEDGFVKLGVEDTHMSRKKQKSNKKELSNVGPAENDSWNQAQQKMLEAAIKSIPKGTPERWDRIAECVTGKTKEEVMARTKQLTQSYKKTDETLFANL
ncbi:60S ribosomal protein L5 [Cichlidogyrus casuarinus]|uniref:60S ribosomal protein L5 n=1 Tax=Cichlidogyrus casuarinus TaxID=1844966 RepID=A0ABD2QIS2_9PLAT